MKRTRPDGTKELEVFEIHGALDYAEQNHFPDEYDQWKFDYCEPHAGWERVRKAKHDQALCKQVNPELFEVPA